jgi:hypothetical protein
VFAEHLSRIFVLVFVLLLAACGRVNNDEYGSTCETDSDCAAVVLSHDCRCGDVVYINRDELDALNERNARVDKREICLLNRKNFCSPEAIQSPYCNAGTCEGRSGLADSE